MLERFVDKKFRVLESIKNSDTGEITNYSVKMTISELELIITNLELNGYIEVEQRSAVPVFVDGEETNLESDEICINYRVLNSEKIKNEFEKTAKKSPTQRSRPLIKSKALELIARKMGDLESGTGLVDFLKNNGVDPELIVYPNTKWRMIFDILQYLSLSGKKEDNDLIFTLIEEISHPLMFNGDRGRALEVQDYFSTCLQYDGYCVDKGKVVEATDEIIEKVDKRVQERKFQEGKGFSELAAFFPGNLFGNTFQDRNKNIEIKKQVNTVEREIPPVHVNIYNNNVQTNTVPQVEAKKTDNSEASPAELDVKFDDDNAYLIAGDRSVAMPPFKNEHLFCRAVFKRKKKEPVDWSIIYQEMTGKAEPDDQEKNKKAVQDTMYAINNRIKEVLETKDDLFIWREKTVTRIH